MGNNKHRISPVNWKDPVFRKTVLFINTQL